jgi:hypothetical protein
MKKSKNKTSAKIISESMLPGEQPNSDAGTLLDENNIL